MEQFPTFEQVVELPATIAFSDHLQFLSVPTGPLQESWHWATVSMPYKAITKVAKVGEFILPTTCCLCTQQSHWALRALRWLVFNSVTS